MRTRQAGAIRFPRLYQVFKTSGEIGEVINRSQSYVKKALRVGFTDREKKMLEAAANRTDLFEGPYDRKATNQDN